jgi:hypothetical protein
MAGFKENGNESLYQIARIIYDGTDNGRDTPRQVFRGTKRRPTQATRFTPHVGLAEFRAGATA